MKKEDIIKLPNEHLRTASTKVRPGEQTDKLVDDMTQAIIDWADSREHESGVALAAIQVDVAKRVVIVREDMDDKNSNTFEAYLNPKILRYSGEIVYDKEGCLSIEDIYGWVPRYSTVKIEATTVTGKVIRFSASGFLARVFQHEIDHTNGITYADRVGSNGTFYSIDENTGDLVEIDQGEQEQLVKYLELPASPVSV